MNNNFEEDFDIEEKELDEIIKAVGKDLTANNNKTSILNLENVKQLIYVYKTAEYLANETNAKASYKLNSPFNSMGSVSIVGKDFKFSTASLFHKVAELASNVDIYPKTDGTVQIDFTFHDLTTIIE